MNSWLKIDNTIPTFSPNQNITALWIDEGAEIEIEPLASAPKSITITIDGIDIPKSKSGRWHFNTRGDSDEAYYEYGGHYELCAQAIGGQEQRVILSIKPTKLTYNCYFAMIKEISRVALDLFTDYHFPGRNRPLPHERMQWTTRNDEISSFHEFPIIQAIMKDMSRIFPTIAKNPHKRPLKKKEIYRNNRRMYRYHHAQPQFGPMGEVVQSDGKVHIPLDWKISPAKSDLNVHENRLLKDFLERKLPERIKHIDERARARIGHLRAETDALRDADWYSKKKEQTDKDISALKEILEACKYYRSTCQKWVNTTFLSSIPPYIPPKEEETKFQTNDSYYLAFYKSCYSKLYKDAFTLMPNIEQCVAKLATRKISEIYEVWSVFELTRFFVKELRGKNYRFDETSPHFYELRKDLFRFDIQKDTAIVLRRKETKIRLIYEPRYVHRKYADTSQSIVTKDKIQQTPDFVIEIYKDGAIQSVLVFEVKYQQGYAGNNRRTRTYPTSGIDQIYRYMQQLIPKHIVSEENNRQHIVKVGFVIAPLNLPIEEQNDRTVRAISLVPEMSKNERAQVDKNLREALSSLL